MKQYRKLESRVTRERRTHFKKIKIKIVVFLELLIIPSPSSHSFVSNSFSDYSPVLLTRPLILWAILRIFSMFSVVRVTRGASRSSSTANTWSSPTTTTMTPKYCSSSPTSTYTFGTTREKKKNKQTILQRWTRNICKLFVFFARQNGNITSIYIYVLFSRGKKMMTRR